MTTTTTATTGPANADDRQNAINGLHDAIRAADAAMTAAYHALIELDKRGDVETGNSLEAFRVANWAIHELRRAAPDSLTGTEPKGPLAVTAADLTAIMKAKGLID